jgi:hypothetical protein
VVRREWACWESRLVLCRSDIRQREAMHISHVQSLVDDDLIGLVRIAHFLFLIATGTFTGARRPSRMPLPVILFCFMVKQV